jgi:CHAT domain-containing protein
MKKIFLLFFLVFLSQPHSWADCPTSKEIWTMLQTTLKKPKNQIGLINLKNVCQRCKINDSTYTIILQKIAENFVLNEDLNQANSILQEAIDLNSSSKNNAQKALIVDNNLILAQILNGKGNYQEALNLCDRTIIIANSLVEKIKLIPQLYARKANILFKMGDFERVISQTTIGISIAKQNQNISSSAKCFVERAKAYVISGNNEEAKKDLEFIIDYIKQEKKSDVLPYAYFVLAEIYLSESKFEEAIKFYKKAQIFYQLNNDEDGYISNYMSIGLAYYYLKDYDKALENYNKGVNIIKRPYVKLLFLDDIAAAYWMKKDYPKAFENYQKALSIAPIGFKSKNTYDNPSITNLKIADFKTYYLTTLTDKADTWLEYYQTTKQKENLKVALDTYVTADKLIDLMRFDHTGTQSKLYWRNKTHHLYVQAIETCFLLKNYEKAFYFFEKSKAVLLNDQLNELSANQQLSATDLAQEKGFQQTITELNKKIGLDNENSKNYDVLQSQLLEQQNKQEQFVKSLEIKNPTYFKYKYDTTLVSLDKVKKYLAKDQVVLEYFMGDDAIYALIISPDKTNLQKIPQLDYSKNAKQFLSYCSDNQKINKNFQDFLLVSNQIYQQIFRYLNVPKGRLIITQDGYFLPFEALSKSSKRAEYLLNDYAISYTYSVQFLLKNLGQNSFSFSHKFMGMSPVNYTKNLNQTSLSGSDISLSEVASNFVFGKKFFAQKATKNAFLSNAKDYKIVHLYTHAQADSTDQEPMIYFADSVLKLSELNALERFKTQLLVLSACKTAVGKNAKGEGILSLSRGFAALGIPATLTTLWSVENQSTYTLNELFYRYLSEGYPKDISLQKAKIEFLQSQSGEKQLPTFWAAAVLVGDAEVVSLSNAWFYLGIVLLLGLLGFWWYRKK